ncbi:MAG: type II toxin-antitoxin system RelE/ParE family toxin [Chloroflexi bacterium]|nr:type II toxin-antitoxin system RelE/ParE family toxin [Chloroflexota bacterium]
MTYSLRLLPEVEEDLIAGYEWYEMKSSGLGEEFLRSFYASVGEIAYEPLLHRKVSDELRRCLLRRFPYAVYYGTEGDQIIVHGVFHCARGPRAIGRQLRTRREPEST